MAPAEILISAGAIALMWQRLLWFPWLIPVAVQAPLALFWSVLVHTGRLRREKQELQVKLAAAELRTVSAEALAGQSATVVDVSPTEPPLVIPDHTLVRPIGKGAYGEVWLAKDIIGSFHAVKVVYRNKFKDGSPFEREFRGIQKFTPISRSHPGFVNILHVGRNDVEGYFYYIMELGDNENGVQKIDPSTYAPKNLLSELQRSGRLPAEECLQIAINLASALQHLHRHQLIHRDIKPSNIIFVNGVSKFADIGLVTEMAGGGRETTYVGTEGYIAPEGPGTAAADVYSLGKLLYEISTGLDRERFPELPTDLISGQPENLIFFRLNKIIVKACEANVSKRFQSAADLHEELLKLQKIPLHNE
jgi:serine/threonine protein kinase